MRCLFVSNLFPPYGWGGYEQWCDEVAQAFALRGHHVAVLTSLPPEWATNAESPPGAADTDRLFTVHRLLHTEVEGGLAETTLRLLHGPARFEAENAQRISALFAAFQPDVVLIWGMWNIARTVPQQIERLMGPRVAYYFCDYWPTLPSAFIQRMQEPARRRSMRSMKRLVGSYFLPRLRTGSYVPLALEHPICVSAAVRRILVSRGVNVAHAQVIYGGTAVEDFAHAAARPRSQDGTLRLVYLGRIEATKGVHTIIQALGQLHNAPGVSLSLIGSGPAEYEAELRQALAEHELEGRVHFLGPVVRSEVPARLGEFDALVFASEWEEPFARTVLEAMAAVLAVIGTTTGGTTEILVEGETGLTYPAGDATRLARQIERLAHGPDLRTQLSSAALAAVRQHFTLDRMVDELETALHAIAVGAPQQDLWRVSC